MASLIGMAKRSEAAQARIDETLAGLVDRLGIDAPEFPQAPRDRVLQDTLRLEWTADVLDTITTAVDGLTEAQRQELADAAVALAAAQQPAGENTTPTAGETDDVDTPPAERPALRELRRGELETYGASIGIEEPANKERFPNIDTLIDAIEARWAGADEA